METVEIKDYGSVSSHFYEKNVTNLFYSPSWIEVLQNTYGFQFFTAIEQTSDKFIIFSIIDTAVGKKIISLPFSDYIELNSDNEYLLILEKIKDNFSGKPIYFKILGTDLPKTDFGQITRRGFLHRINTTNLKEAITNQSSSFKRGVRKAEKSGIEITLSREFSDMEQFYALYHDLRKNKFESIPQPFSFFDHIYSSFIQKKKGFILQALFENKVIASIIVLQFKDTLYYKFGCSSSTYLNLRPNNILFDRLITYACKNNFSCIDLGFSGASEAYEGLVRFKESIGGKKQSLTHFKFSGDEKYRKYDRHINEVMSSLTEIIVSEDLEASSTSRFSEVIYHFFA